MKTKKGELRRDSLKLNDEQEYSKTPKIQLHKMQSYIMTRRSNGTIQIDAAPGH